MMSDLKIIIGLFVVIIFLSIAISSCNNSECESKGARFVNTSSNGVEGICVSTDGRIIP
jgi:putative hemolysin